MSWGAVGGAAVGVAGSLIGGAGQKDAAGDAADAQIMAALIAAKAARPYSVSGPGATIDMDYKTKTMSTALTPQAQGLLDIYAGEAGQGLDAATQERLGIMDQLAARGEEDARRFTTERLFAAGNLGTHAGSRQIGEVERAIQDARLNRMLSARTMAFNERAGAFNNALSLYQLPNTLAPLSRNNGQAAAIMGQGFMNAASIQGAADMGYANQMTQLYSQVGGALGTWAGNKIGDIFSSPSPATSAMGGYTIAAPGGSF